MKKVSGFFILLLLGALGAAGYFAWQNYQLRSKPQPSQLQPKEVQLQPTPTAQTAQVDEFSDWLDFGSRTDLKNVSVGQTPDNYIQVSVWGPTQEKDTEFYDGINLLFKFNPLNGQTLEAVVDNSVQESQVVGEIITAKTPMSLNNYDGFTYTSQGLGVFRYIFLEWPGQGYMEIIDGTNDPTGQGYKEIVEKILLTLEYSAV